MNNPLAPKPSDRVCPKCGNTLMTHYTWLMDAESYGCETHGSILRCTRTGVYEFKDGSVHDRDGNLI